MKFAEMGRFGAITLLILAWVLVWVTTSACQPTRVVLPIHSEPPGTDLGGDYLAGEIRLEQSCLKLYRMGWDNPQRSASQQLRDIWLLVWPPGYAIQKEGQEMHVIDDEGMSVALVGDTVRLGGGTYWYQDYIPEELEK